MHTIEHAKTLWCPMARVGQAGDRDIDCAYNRSLTKMPIATDKLKAVDAEGKETMRNLYINEIRVGESLAANCIADKCAAWRWNPEHPVGHCGLAGRPVGND